MKKELKKIVEGTKKFLSTPSGKLYIAYMVYVMYYTYVTIKQKGKEGERV